MEIYIDKIGKIIDSKIKIEGLTVISGLNDTGKTTAGKVVYSLFSSLNGIEKSAVSDSTRSISKKIRSKFISLFGDDSLLYSRIMPNREISNGTFEEFQSMPLSYSNIRYLSFDNPESIELWVKNTMIFFQNGKGDSRIEKSIRRRSNKISFDNFEIENERNKILKFLEEMLNELAKPIDYFGYVSKIVAETLNHEFNNQLLVIPSIDSDQGIIKVSESGETLFDVKVTDNITNVEYFGKSPITDALLIDNPFDIDDIRSDYNRRLFILNDMSALTDRKTKLIRKFTFANRNVYDELKNDIKTSEIMKVISQAINYEIVKGKNGLPTTQEKIHINNLAAGSKSFLIIKELLKNHSLNNTTILILDEPEVHLHPQWQVIYAEMVVLLVKHLGLKILLTTHSPNFLLAIDVFTKKHGIRNTVNFYDVVSSKSTAHSSFHLVNNRIDKVYLHMTKPFIDLDALKNDIELNNE